MQMFTPLIYQSKPLLMVGNYGNPQFSLTGRLPTYVTGNFDRINTMSSLPTDSFTVSLVSGRYGT